MWRRIKWPLIIAFVALTGLAFRAPAEKYFDIAKSLDIFATLFKEVNAYYVDEVNPEKLVDKGIEGMLQSLDPYTDYIAEDEMESFRISTTGQYAGIGAVIGVVDGKTVITHPYQDFPAFRAGLKVGDELISVDGKAIHGMSTAEISRMLKGQPRTTVEVQVKRFLQNENLAFRIRREKISVTNISYFGLITPEIGFIRLDDFTQGASREVSEAVTKLRSQGAKKLVLDLRDNPGGLLHEAINVVNLFVPKGQEVVSTRGKAAEWNKSYTTLNTTLDATIPIVVLTNGGSASASEIVAGALQDYDRAVLIGEKTFGKGLVQTTRPLKYNGQLKVTTARYYIPSGRCIQALDYTHRKADGTVTKVADSLKAEFKTRHGRTVWDGGGLDPDLHIADENFATVTTELIAQGFIFTYASLYCAGHPQAPDLKSFRLSDAEYEKFIQWTRDNHFVYATPMERSAKALIEAAKEERYASEMQAQLDALKVRITETKATDLQRFKHEIAQALEEQIGFHYALGTGQAEVSLSRDKVVRESQRILSDTVAYHKILSPQ